MKIALVSAYFFPNSQGGTEKYVLKLAEKLINENNDVDIITANTTTFNIYQYQNIKVYSLSDKIPTASDTNKAPTNESTFQEILIDQNYEIVHFHTLTPAFNIAHFEIAKKTGAKIYFTAHVPGITCIHGDLMKFGQSACDGLIIKSRCTACYLSKKGLSNFKSYLLANAINLFNYPILTAQAVKNKKLELKDLNNLCDKIFLFTNWQKEVFIKNGFKIEKIILTNQFLDKKLIPKKTQDKQIKRIGFVGRISKEKGLFFLLKAFIKANRLDLELDIAGIKNDDDYLRMLQLFSQNNSNINWHYNLNPVDLNLFYQKIDLLVIPSIWFETGPYVLYEALELNLPIVANNLGDMSIWRDKGFSIKVYNTQNELINIIHEL